MASERTPLPGRGEPAERRSAWPRWSRRSAGTSTLERSRSAHTQRAYLGDVRNLLGYARRHGVDDLAAIDLALLRSWLASLTSGRSGPGDGGPPRGRGPDLPGLGGPHRADPGRPLGPAAGAAPPGRPARRCCGPTRRPRCWTSAAARRSSRVTRLAYAIGPPSSCSTPPVRGWVSWSGWTSTTSTWTGVRSGSSARAARSGGAVRRARRGGRSTPG